MSSDPVAYLHAAHARAEKVANALPRGPWAWTRYSDPHWCHTLEGPDGFTEAVLKSATQSPGASWIELHPSFDEFLPDPEAVLRRIAADRKLIAEHKTVRVLARDTGWDEECDVCHVRNEWLPCSTIKHLAEGWGWTEETT